MSGFITNAGENYLLNLITGAISPLDSYYVALIQNEPPTTFSSGMSLDEPASEDYARAEMVNLPGHWTEATGEVANLFPVEFTPALGWWGTMNYYAICDSEEGGEVLWAGDFPVPITIDEDDQVVLQPGSLVLRATGYRSRMEM